MKYSLYGNGDAERRRLYNMEINALIGYIVAELGILSARLLNLTSISYMDLLYLSTVVNFTTIFFIVYLRLRNDFSPDLIRIFFFIQLIIYVSMYGITVIQANEFRLLVLVYALLAVSSLLPFATPREIILVSMSSIAAHIAATYYAIYHIGQKGEFLHDLVYTLSFCPTLIMIIFVSRQINIQKYKIRYSMSLAEEMNSKLVSVNKELEISNRIAKNELDLAAQLQMSILPDIQGNFGNWDIAHIFKPKYGVSGDIYDFYADRGDLKGISVFDVSGHGISSALLTMIVKPIAFRWFNQMRDRSLSDIIREVNQGVSREISRLDDFITCVMLRFHGTTAEYANAGHPDVLVRSGDTGKTRVVRDGGNIFKGEPLGINMSGIAPRSITFPVGKGDCILVCTDCILETRNSADDHYGLDRLARSLDNAPPGSSHDILDFILQQFYSFLAGAEIRDDLTVIVARKIS